MLHNNNKKRDNPLIILFCMTTIVFLMQYFNFETLALIGHMMHDADAITNLYSLVDI